MNEKINFQDLAARLAEEANISKRDAEIFLREYFDVLNEELIKNNLLKIKDLGTFKLSLMEARESINVTTGERFLIPAHYKVIFTPDKNLAEKVNEPFTLFETTEIEDDYIYEELKLFSEEQVLEISPPIKAEKTISKPKQFFEKKEKNVSEDKPIPDEPLNPPMGTFSVEEIDPVPDEEEDEIIPEDALIPDEEEDKIIPEDVLIPDEEEDEIIPEDTLIPDEEEDEIIPEDALIPDEEEDEIIPEDVLIPDEEEDEIIPEDALIPDEEVEEEIVYESELISDEENEKIIPEFKPIFDEKEDYDDDIVLESKLIFDKGDEEIVSENESVSCFDEEIVTKNESITYIDEEIVTENTLILENMENEKNPDIMDGLLFEQHLRIEDSDEMNTDDRSVSNPGLKNFCYNCHDYQAHIAYRKKYFIIRKRLTQLRIVIYILSVLLAIALIYIAASFIKT